MVVISPNQIKNLRGWYGSAGSKDDRFDADVLADTLRTDRGPAGTPDPRQPGHRDPAPRLPGRKDLVTHRVALANQLRAHLRNAFPGAATLFAETGSPISLRFLARFGTQDRAGWLSPRRLAAWLASAGYSGRTGPAVLHARLAAAPRGATGDDGTTQAHATAALHAVLTTLTEQIKTLSEQSPSSSPCTPTRISSPRCPARAPAAPPACSPRSATAAPASPPRSPRLPRRRRTFHPAIRQTAHRQLPLVVRQATPRRRHRLRRRLPSRQPLGHQPLQPGPRPRPRPPPRRPHPRPRLALHHLALPARPRRLDPAKHRAPQTLLNQDQQAAA